MKREGLSSLLGVSLLFGGCPKRHRNPQIVYVPAPPPTAAPAAGQPAETLVLEEPAPSPEPVETQAEKPLAQKPARPTRRPPLPNEASGASVPPAESVEPPPAAEVPTLESRQSQERAPELKGEILRYQNEAQQRIGKLLQRANLATADRKTIDDARAFLAQSAKALEEGDLQRSLNLARKGYLLVAALDQGQ